MAITVTGLNIKIKLGSLKAIWFEKKTAFWNDKIFWFEKLKICENIKYEKSDFSVFFFYFSVELELHSNRIVNVNILWFVIAYYETFKAYTLGFNQILTYVKMSFIILSCRGPGGGRPWPNPTNANSVSICVF